MGGGEGSKRNILAPISLLLGALEQVPTDLSPNHSQLWAESARESLGLGKLLLETDS